MTAELTRQKVRHLSSTDLGVALPSQGGSTHATEPDAFTDLLDPDDPILVTVLDLLNDYGGVLFTGPPGTSKSHYATRIARTIAGAASRVRTVQFHPSYQYEDFIQGYVATATGMQLANKHFVLACQAATADPGQRYVIVIDELSRADPGRVFGEALTYLERTKRGETFLLASGDALMVPPNLDILATMNPLDRGVDEVDAALNRRFAKYAMDPSEDYLTTFLIAAGMPDVLRQRVLSFFRSVNREAAVAVNPHAVLGHTYFQNIRDIPGLIRLWDHQLRFHFEQAYRLDISGLEKIRTDWSRITASLPGSQVADDGGATGSEPAFPPPPEPS